MDIWAVLAAAECWAVFLLLVVSQTLRQVYCQGLSTYTNPASKSTESPDNSDSWPVGGQTFAYQNQVEIEPMAWTGNPCSTQTENANHFRFEPRNKMIYSPTPPKKLPSVSLRCLGNTQKKRFLVFLKWLNFSIQGHCVSEIYTVSFFVISTAHAARKEQILSSSLFEFSHFPIYFYILSVCCSTKGFNL